MARDSQDMWQALSRGGEVVASEEDYEHGYKREVRQDLQQYVAFRVAGENYGVPIAEISEISKPFETTPVPRTAPFVLGIGNVRGIVLPVVDLALRLGLESSAERAVTGRILIVRRHDDLYGMLVDGVHSVVTVAPEELEEAPGAIAGPRGEYIKALGRFEGDILIMLDLAPLLDPRDFVAASLRGRRTSG